MHEITDGIVAAQNSTPESAHQVASIECLLCAKSDYLVSECAAR